MGKLYLRFPYYYVSNKLEMCIDKDTSVSSSKNSKMSDPALKILVIFSFERKLFLLIFPWYSSLEILFSNIRELRYQLIIIGYSYREIIHNPVNKRAKSFVSCCKNIALPPFFSNEADVEFVPPWKFHTTEETMVFIIRKLRYFIKLMASLAQTRTSVFNGHA